MAKRRGLIQVIILLLLLALAGCAKKGDRMVARVGNHPIRLKEFEEAFSRNKAPNVIKASSFEDKKEHLQSMINRQLKIIDAYRKNLDQDPEIRKELKTTEKWLVYRKFLEVEIIDKNIPESEIREYYQHSGEEVKVKHILLKVPPDATKEQEEQVKKRIREILRKIKRGESFAQLAKQYSEDPISAKKGGDRGYLKWGGGASKDEFYRTAFSLKEGQVSDPVRTSEGYHLIKVVDRKTYPRGNYEQERDRIKGTLFRQRQKELEKLFFEYVDQMKRKYRTKYHEDNIALFASRLSPEVTREQPSPVNQFARVTEEDKKLALVSYQGGSITIGDVIKEISRQKPYQQPQLRNEKGIRGWLDNRFLPYELLSREAYRRGLQKDSEIQKRLEENMERLMLRKIQDREVNQKVKPTEEDYRRYFEENRENYKSPERIKVQEIFIKENEELADKVAERAKKGEDFTQLARKYNERKLTKHKDGILGFITKKQYGPIGKRALEMAPGEIAGPIKRGRNFSVIKVLDKKPSELKTYQEVKTQVGTEFRKKVAGQKEREWLDKLRNEITIVISEDVLKGAFSDLE